MARNAASCRHVGWDLSEVPSIDAALGRHWTGISQKLHPRVEPLRAQQAVCWVLTHLAGSAAGASSWASA